MSVGTKLHFPKTTGYGGYNHVPYHLHLGPKVRPERTSSAQRDVSRSRRDNARLSWPGDGWGDQEKAPSGVVNRDFVD